MPTGRAMWQMIGVLAELERSLISERTRAGVKAAKDRGVKFGRKPKLTLQQINHARKLIDEGQRREDVASLLNVDWTALYRSFACSAQNCEGSQCNDKLGELFPNKQKGPPE